MCRTYMCDLAGGCCSAIEIVVVIIVFVGLLIYCSPHTLLCWITCWIIYAHNQRVWTYCPFSGVGERVIKLFHLSVFIKFFLFLSFCNIDFNISNKVVIIMEINSWKVTKAVTNDLMREETDHFTSHSRHQYHINHIVQFSHSVGQFYYER